MSFYYGDYWSAPTLKAVDDMIENKVPRAIVCANDMMAIAAGLSFKDVAIKYLKILS